MNSQVKASLWSLLGFCCGVCLVLGATRLITGGEPPLLDVLLLVAGLVLAVPLFRRVTWRNRAGAPGAGASTGAGHDPQ